VRTLVCEIHFEADAFFSCNTNFKAIIHSCSTRINFGVNVLVVSVGYVSRSGHDDAVVVIGFYFKYI